VNPSRPSRYESLDLWRGLACLTVVVFHAGYGYAITKALKDRVFREGGSIPDYIAIAVSGLWMGVPLFFVISGYCIAASADSIRNKPYSAGNFFVRRFRRIYPPLWAFLILAAILVASMPSYAIPGPTETFERPMPYPGELHGTQWFGSISLTETWRYHIFGPGRDYFSGQLWTLCYEEQFYLVATLLILVSKRRFFTGIVLVTFGVFCIAFDWKSIGGPDWLDFKSSEAKFLGFFFDGLWLSFAAGVGIYYRAVHAGPKAKFAIDATLLAGIVWMNAAKTGWLRPPDCVDNLTVAFPFALLLSFLRKWDADLARAKVLAPFQFCGRMCYSLYLVHAPITILISWNLYRLGVQSSLGTLLITIPLGTSLSLLAGYLFHRYIEKRFLNAPLK
jgi:peptidoglycan/LPS O-acetylase OafA/YrhL